MATRKNTAPVKAQSHKTASRNTPNFWKRYGLEGSIAHMLSDSPGGAGGALKRLEAAKAAGLQPTVAIALGEEPGSSKGLSALLDQMLDLVGHFRLADQYLQGEFSQLDEELQSAAVVLHRATAELDALHTQIDSWHVHHHHYPKPPLTEEILRAREEAAA